MKILVTGFEPFGGMNINPTERLAKTLQEETIDSSVKIAAATLPVVYDDCVSALIKVVETEKPDVIICCGLAFGREAVTVERIGINVKDTAGEGLKGDNRGGKPQDDKIVVDGPDGIFSTLPIRFIVNDLKNDGIPALISNSAGTYICNNTLYGILHYIETNDLPIKAGFIHFPATPEMVIDKPTTASMSFETQLKALNTIVKTVIK